jgi:hypothetical protein
MLKDKKNPNESVQRTRILVKNKKVYFELNKTNEVKFWLTIYSYFDVSMIMVIIIKKNKYLKKSQKIIK